MKTDDIERELAELLAHRLLVEHAEHGVFAMYRRHDGDAEIDQTPFVANPEAAVLGHAPLGDIQFAHDLDAGKDGGVVFPRDGRHSRLQNAVDAVLDDQRVVIRFQVDVRGAALERGEDGGIHQPDDGADVLFRSKLLDRDVLIGIIFGRDDVKREPFRRLVENAL
jgi:hypothetical protein